MSYDVIIDSGFTTEEIEKTRKGWLKDADGTRFAPYTLDHSVFIEELDDEGNLKTLNSKLKEIVKYGLATPYEDGLMSAGDKNKLDKINIIYLTRSEYNALEDPISDALYIITDEDLKAEQVSYEPSEVIIDGENDNGLEKVDNVQDAIDTLGKNVDNLSKKVNTLSLTAANVSYDEEEENLLKAENVQDAIDEVAKNFQDGCQALTDKCAECGVSPASNGVKDICNAIEEIYSLGYSYTLKDTIPDRVGNENIYFSTLYHDNPEKGANIDFNNNSNKIILKKSPGTGEIYLAPGRYLFLGTFTAHHHALDYGPNGYKQGNFKIKIILNDNSEIILTDPSQQTESEMKRLKALYQSKGISDFVEKNFFKYNDEDTSLVALVNQIKEINILKTHSIKQLIFYFDRPTFYNSDFNYDQQAAFHYGLFNMHAFKVR